MAQSVKSSHNEILVNTVIGIMIGWLVMFFIVPHFDGWSDGSRATITSLVFVTTSYARAYLLRRYFNRRVS